MSAIKDKVREEIAKLEYCKYGEIMGCLTDKWEDEPDNVKERYLGLADEILVIPELAVVDREVEMPSNYNLDNVPGLHLSLTALFDIRRELKNLLINWVKEEK